MPTPEAQLERAHRQIARLRWYVIGLFAAVVFSAVVIPFGVIYFQRQATENATLVVTCQSARANVAQLKALRALEHRLGLPVDLRIPVISKECP